MPVDRQASSALSASAVALLLCGVGVMMFLPPLVDETVASLPRTALFGLVIVASLLLHGVFLAIAAQRQGRTAGRWLMLVVLLPVLGSIVALVMLTWFESEAKAAAEGMLQG